MDHDNEARGRREVFLSVLLSGLAVSGALFFFFLLCGGFSIYAIAVVATVTLVGFAHYLLWGHALNRSVAGEREEEEVREHLDEEGWPPEEPHGTQHW